MSFAVYAGNCMLIAKQSAVYQLKTPYRDGTAHFVFEPNEFLARLAALVPRPRGNLVRYHGILAPNAKHRSAVVPNSSKRTRRHARLHTLRCRRWVEIIRTIPLHRPRR